VVAFAELICVATALTGVFSYASPDTHAPFDAVNTLKFRGTSRKFADYGEIAHRSPSWHGRCSKTTRDFCSNCSVGVSGYKRRVKQNAVDDLRNSSHIVAAWRG
jgi:hypothetical protein